MKSNSETRNIKAVDMIRTTKMQRKSVWNPEASAQDHFPNSVARQLLKKPAKNHPDIIQNNTCAHCPPSRPASTSFSQPLFWCLICPWAKPGRRERPFVDHWDQSPGQTGRQHQVAAEAASLCSLSPTRSPGKRSKFCPVIQHHSGFGAFFTLLMGRFLAKGGKYSSH